MRANTAIQFFFFLCFPLKEPYFITKILEQSHALVLYFLQSRAMEVSETITLQAVQIFFHLNYFIMQGIFKY